MVVALPRVLAVTGDDHVPSQFFPPSNFTKQKHRDNQARTDESWDGKVKKKRKQVKRLEPIGTSAGLGLRNRENRTALAREKILQSEYLANEGRHDIGVARRRQHWLDLAQLELNKHVLDRPYQQNQKHLFTEQRALTDDMILALSKSNQSLKHISNERESIYERIETMIRRFQPEQPPHRENIIQLLQRLDMLIASLFAKSNTCAPTEIEHLRQIHEQRAMEIQDAKQDLRISYAEIESLKKKLQWSRTKRKEALESAIAQAYARSSKQNQSEIARLKLEKDSILLELNSLRREQRKANQSAGLVDTEMQTDETLFVSKPAKQAIAIEDERFWQVMEHS